MNATTSAPEPRWTPCSCHPCEHGFAIPAPPAPEPPAEPEPAGYDEESAPAY